MEQGIMKVEDKWLVIIITFTLLFTASFFWGLWG